MAINKITDKQAVDATASNTHVLLTQNVTMEGQAVNDVVRMPLETFKEEVTGELKSAITHYATLSNSDATIIPDNTDYNTLTTPGNYRVTTAAHAATMTNAPSTLAHRLFVMATHNASYIMQFALVSSASNFVIKARVKSDQNAWYPSNGEWVTFINNKSISSDLSAFLDTTLAVSGKAADAKSVGDKLTAHLALLYSDAETISSNTDYNTLVTPGNYKCTTASSAGTMTNAPSSVAHRLFVISTHKATYIMQIALISTGSSFTIKARVKTDQDAWYPSNGEWITFTTDKNLSSIIDTTLAVSGKAADSKTTGDAINALPQFRQYLNDNSGITAIADILTTPGWYGWGSAYASSITDLPSNFGNSAGGVEIITPVYANSTFTVSLLYDNKGNVWKRNWKNTTKEPTSDWILEYGPMSEKNDPAYYSWTGKKVAIIGNSISTNDDYDPENNPYGNVPEIYIQQEDVGHTLSAYVTFWDVWADTSKTSGTGLTLKIGGTRRALTDDDIGTEITFVPEAQDVGHMVGKPVSYYRKSYGIKVWWDIAAESLGFTPVPVCWSGSSMTSHENGKAIYKTAHAWHDATIRKCGIRIPGGMTRTAPDVIILYRVANDMTHDTSGIYRVRQKVSSGDLWDYPGTYPETDVAGTTGNYTFGFEEATLLTVKKLREAYPKAIIMLATDVTIKRVMFDEFPTRNGINTLPQYNKVIREVADYLGCHLIEFDKNGVTFENLEDYTRDQADPSHPTTGLGPTHPNAKGQRIMANRALIDMKKINAFET